MASLALAFDILAKDRASAEFNKVADSAEKTGKRGSAAFALLTGAAVAAGAAAVKIGMDSIRSASDAEQALGGVQTVFGTAVSAVEEYASRSGRSLGLAAQDYNELAAVVGSQLQRMGQSQEESAVSTDKLITLGADLAATYGGSVTDAVSAVGALLRGERDPIERYGVGINDAAVKARLLEQGLGGLTGAALEQAKGQATLALLTEQTAKVQGAAGRESGTLQGQTIRLSAQYKDLTAQLGTALLPTIVNLIGKVQSLIGFVERNSTVISILAGTVGTAAAGLAIATKAVAAFNAVSVAMGSSLTIALGPIGLVIIAIAAVAAGLVIAYKQSETFRNIVNAVFGSVRSAAEGLLNFARSIPAAIRGVFSNFGSLLTGAGRELIAGLISGVVSKLASLRAAMSKVASTIKGFLPGSPVKTGPLTSWNRGKAGTRLMELLASGIDGKPVSRALNDALDMGGMRLGGASFVQDRLAATAGTAARATSAATVDMPMLATLREQNALLAEQNELLRGMPRKTAREQTFADRQNAY